TLRIEPCGAVRRLGLGPRDGTARRLSARARPGGLRLGAARRGLNLDLDRQLELGKGEAAGIAAAYLLSTLGRVLRTRMARL
ncbi:MAG: hypothetical protein ACTSQ7_12580, partial [Alphaproteobacteria bacterium]